MAKRKLKLKLKLATSPLTQPRKKARSKASGDLTPKSTKPLPFFEYLNYDVRMLIYMHMRLPPWSNGSHWKGFILSCRQAHLEASESAGRRLKAALIAFTNNLEGVQVPNIPIGEGFKALKELTLQSSVNYMPLSEFERLSPLLNLYLDKITYVFKGDEVAARKVIEPPRLQHEVTAALTDSIYGGLASRRMPWLRSMALDLRTVAVWISTDAEKAIHTKQIAIAWDLLPEDSERMTRLRRPTLQGSERTYPIWDFDQWGVSEENLQEELRKVKKYELSGKDGLLGECGLRSDYRWVLRPGENVRSLWLYTPTRKISSQGIGQDIVEG
ncbi:hypothetical protein BU26DRAFT_553069 [Trematosphaeria pertusa]|uniref:Uncharacterized protein n=1 Tax=Trematosphaeria pertusa TaxID=390896 RepID=A0A6A6I702_9PLEO|nr:uncharacterized protein BU26DRAFT_553069 [Trematosphaeria pertusa]KAF2246117.1 hypothetical protein BU26DRAFT_553069 [Trematosphaeria pertusa]